MTEANESNDATSNASGTETIAESQRGEFPGNLSDVANAAASSTEQPTEGTQEGSTEEPGWYVTPEVKGEGEKPEWFNDKQYKSVYDQAKSASDMRKKLGAFPGAPDEYGINLGDDLKGVELDKDDALFKDFTAFAKNNKMSEEAYNDCLKLFVNYTNLQNDHQGKELDEFQAMELEKLGGSEKAKEKIDEMCQWFSQNFPDGNVQDFKDMMYFADAYDILHGMRNRMGYSKVPSSGDTQPELISSHELRALQADSRYLSQPDFQRMVDNKYQQKYGK